MGVFSAPRGSRQGRGVDARHGVSGEEARAESHHNGGSDEAYAGEGHHHPKSAGEESRPIVDPGRHRADASGLFRRESRPVSLGAAATRMAASPAARRGAATASEKQRAVRFGAG